MAAFDEPVLGVGLDDGGGEPEGEAEEDGESDGEGGLFDEGERGAWGARGGWRERGDGPGEERVEVRFGCGGGGGCWCCGGGLVGQIEVVRFGWGCGGRSWGGCGSGCGCGCGSEDWGRFRGRWGAAVWEGGAFVESELVVGWAAEGGVGFEGLGFVDRGGVDGGGNLAGFFGGIGESVHTVRSWEIDGALAFGCWAAGLDAGEGACWGGRGHGGWWGRGKGSTISKITLQDRKYSLGFGFINHHNENHG